VLGALSEAARMRAEAADTKVDPLTIKPMNDRIVVDYSGAGLDPITAQMPIAGAPEAAFKSEADRAAGDNWINKVSARIGANLEPAQATGVELGLRRRDLAAIANAPISGAANNTNPTWPFGEFENTGRLSDIPKRPVGFAVEAGKEIWNGMEAGFGGGAVVSGAAGAIGSVGNLAKLRAEAAAVWTTKGIGPTTRGKLLERVHGMNLPSNFPVIDRFADGVATSIKSVDLNSRTYRDVSALKNKVIGDVNALARFQRAERLGVVVDASMIRARRLEVIIPQGASNAQIATLNQATTYAKSKGVTLVVIQYPK
jgi:filamentous hemagglutinin